MKRWVLASDWQRISNYRYRSMLESGSCRGGWSGKYVRAGIRGFGIRIVIRSIARIGAVVHAVRSARKE